MAKGNESSIESVVIKEYLKNSLYVLGGLTVGLLGLAAGACATEAAESTRKCLYENLQNQQHYLQQAAYLTGIAGCAVTEVCSTMAACFSGYVLPTVLIVAAKKKFG